MEMPPPIFIPPPAESGAYTHHPGTHTDSGVGRGVGGSKNGLGGGTGMPTPVIFGAAGAGVGFVGACGGAAGSNTMLPCIIIFMGAGAAAGGSAG
jgi:hypothetical protein